MWFYWYPHWVYHLTRWFSKNNRIKIRVIIFVLTAALLVPQFYILLVPKSVRACDAPLFPILVASIIFLFFTAGYTVIFCTFDPVPKQIKWTFHVFGLASFILGLITIAYTLRDQLCAEFVPELYIWCYVSSILALITTAYYIIVVPFWITEKVQPGSVLNWKAQTGICYEPVTCFSCIWHV